MMKKPKYINLFIDCADEFGMISDLQAGRLIKALLRYANGGGEPDFADDTALRVLFSIMKKQIAATLNVMKKRPNAVPPPQRKPPRLVTGNPILLRTHAIAAKTKTKTKTKTMTKTKTKRIRKTTGKPAARRLFISLRSER